MNKYDDIKRFMDKTNLKELDYKELNDKSTGESITGSMNQWTLIKQVSASQTPGGPLDSGRSTQPTPQSISADEFSPSSAQEALHHAQHSQSFIDASHARDEPRSSEVSPPAAGFGLLDALRETLPPTPADPTPAPALKPQSLPVHSTPSLHAQSVVPDSGSGLLDSLRKAMPETVRQSPVAPPAAAQPATPVSTAPVHQPAPVSRSAPVHTPAPVASADTEQRFKQMFKQRVPQPASAYLHRDTPLQPLLEMIASCR
ncbi:cellulose biosynthesis protein BcsO [Enterobacteriaceae bacterium Kacie_13]|nr:cellulose biosynthesis protein BcsO [Enterobacteriaceae bacterium Kacie_13]